jgi:hypothetical protein
VNLPGSLIATWFIELDRTIWAADQDATCLSVRHPKVLACTSAIVALLDASYVMDDASCTQGMGTEGRSCESSDGEGGDLLFGDHGLSTREVVADFARS